MKHSVHFFASHPLRVSAGCTALFLTTAAAAQGGSLEDQLFGGETPAQTPTSAPASANPAPAASNSTVQAVQGTSGDTLTLGGRLELQTLLSKTARRTLGDATLLNTTGAELYLDARPNDDLRGFIKGALISRSGAQSVPALNVYETWLKWSGRGSVFTTLGRQKLKWGAATFWNPSDFFALQPKDPLAPFDVRPGANLLKVHVPFEKTGHNIYGLVSLENSSKANDPKLAARGEFNYGLGDFSGELTATVAGGRKQPQQFAIDLSTSAGPVDLIVEAALTRQSDRTFYRRMTRADGTQDVESETRDRQNIRQIVGGLRYDLKYSESDSANFSLEYFWNEFGSSDPVIEAVSLLRGQSQRLYLAHRYLAASLLLAQPAQLNDSTLLFSGLWNMADKSWLVRGGWTERLNLKSSLIIAMTRAGGLGEFTGGIPTSVASEIRKSSQAAQFNGLLGQLEGLEQQWTLSATASLEL